jgi:transcriptional regulator NrdR family protein
MEIKVQKKDGSLQDFDRSKITNSLVKAGFLFDQAEGVASQVTDWVQTSADNGVAMSANIRLKVRNYQKTA